MLALTGIRAISLCSNFGVLFTRVHKRAECDGARVCSWSTFIALHLCGFSVGKTACEINS